jgi:hypothetical protein
VLTDRFKDLKHTYAIVFAVPQVELPETFTRKLRTIVIELPQYLVAAKYGAVFMALPVRSITSSTPVLFPQKTPHRWHSPCNMVQIGEGVLNGFFTLMEGGDCL